MLLWRKDESGLSLCQEQPPALLGPGGYHGSPAVVSASVFLLPVAEETFGSKEKERNSEVESVGSYSPYLM